jgi:hypothetical protein
MPLYTYTRHAYILEHLHAQLIFEGLVPEYTCTVCQIFSYVYVYVKGTDAYVSLLILTHVYVYIYTNHVRAGA